MEAGVRRHITSPSALADCGYGWDAIYLVLDSLLNPIATGAPSPGRLVRISHLRTAPT